jgi:hypothetical protein
LPHIPKDMLNAAVKRLGVLHRRSRLLRSGNPVCLDMPAARGTERDVNKRQYQIIALGIILGSLLIVSIVSRMLSTLLPTTPPVQDNAAQPVAANDTGLADQIPGQALPDPASAAMQQQNAPQTPAMDPAAPAFDPQPTLDTSGISVSGSDASSADGQPSGSESPSEAATSGVQPEPAQ